MNAIFNRLASFALGAILGVALSAPALADSVIAPPAVPYAPTSTGLGDGQSWRYIGAAGCYWNSQGRTISVSSYMSQGGGGRNLYITVNGLDVGANMAGYTYMDRLTVSTIVPANSSYCIHASNPGATVTYALM